jgi:hypothetical protein
MMLRSLVLSFGAALVTVGCLAPPSSAQRLTDNAIEMNTAMRFGRMDIAGDYVKQKARQTFATEHAAWGKSLRIVDLEYSGMQMKENDEAETYVTVSWQMFADPTMHETKVIQHWTTEKGKWSIDSETTEGDVGLLAKAKKPQLAPMPMQMLKGAAAGDGAAEEGPPPLPTVQLAPNKSRYQTRVIYDD